MLGKMTRPQQQWLSDRIMAELEAFQTVQKLEPQQMVYWLVSFTWGYAKRLGWENRAIASYSLAAWEKCEQLWREGSQKQPPPP